MADMSAEFGELNLARGGHRLQSENSGDSAARLAGFSMYVGGLGATATGNPGGLKTAYDGLRIAFSDSPRQALRKKITGSATSLALGEAGQAIVDHG